MVSSGMAVAQVSVKRLRSSMKVGRRMTRKYGLLCGPTSSSCGGLWPCAEDLLCFALWDFVSFFFVGAFLGLLLCAVVTLGLQEGYQEPDKPELIKVADVQTHICATFPIICTTF